MVQFLRLRHQVLPRPCLRKRLWPSGRGLIGAEGGSGVEKLVVGDEVVVPFPFTNLERAKGLYWHWDEVH